MNSFRSSSPDGLPHVAAVVVAGGSGHRMGERGVRKQYLEIDGIPVLLRALRPFLAHPLIRDVVAVLPRDAAASPPDWLDGLPIEIVAGGLERGDSVWNGLAALASDIDTVLVHDGARPFVSVGVIDRVIEGARAGAAIAAVRVTDTLKRADAFSAIIGTVDRSNLWQAQTPQGFPLATLRAAYLRARGERWTATDDSALCERYGIPVLLVEGARENIKITHPSDLSLAGALARGLREDEDRIT